MAYSLHLGLWSQPVEWRDNVHKILEVQIMHKEM